MKQLRTSNSKDSAARRWRTPRTGRFGFCATVGGCLVLAVGCATGRPFAKEPKFPVDQDWLRPDHVATKPAAEPDSPPGSGSPSENRPPTQDKVEPIIRSQDPSSGFAPSTSPPQGTTVYSADPYATTLPPSTLGRPGTPQEGPVFSQQPGPTTLNPTPLPQVGDPNAVNPLPGPPPFGIGQTYFDNTADLDIYAQESMTGRIMVGGAYNSDAGLTGQITIDERNFDIWRFPTSWSDITEGRAFRGAGQGFRLELLPGSQVQRYMFSLTEPYLFNSLISFSGSGYYYTRNFFDWDEQRLGGQVSLGYRLTPELSVSAGTRLENVKIYDPRVNTSPQLNAAQGSHDLFLGFVRLVNDTRDHPFLATEGAYFEAAYNQAFGDFSYPRADLDYRRYFLMYQRPDYSGRHTLSLGMRLGYTGSDTPVFENYFAGGFSTMRGFSFRGASPVEGGVRVGGEFQWLNSVEYMFPLTADDMVRGVVFCDYGTIEDDVRLDMDNFRVAPGFGFRVHMPAAGAGGAPLAFDFAFPMARSTTDELQMFSFYMSVNR